MKRQKTIAALITAVLGTAQLIAEPLEIGMKIPKIIGVTESGEKFDFQAKGAKGRLLVYFYPKAGTAG